MDPTQPIQMVIHALISGLVAGVGETSKSYVKDSYEQLKNALLTKMKGHSTVSKALTKLEDSPNSKQARENLETELYRTNIEIDKSILEIALSLINLINSQKSESEKYSISVKNSNNIVIGDHAKIEMDIQLRKKLNKSNRAIKKMRKK